MADLDEIRKQESEQAYQHLLAIRKIASYKAARDGADKAIGELLINGFFQFSFKDGLDTFECRVPNCESRETIDHLDQFEKNASVSVDLTGTDIHAENRDIVRHLIGLRNIKNTKWSKLGKLCWL